MIAPDAQIREILQNTKVIAMVGASMNPARPSYGVMQFLLGKGLRVIPVNPGHAGEMLQGARVYATLKDIPKDFAVDMVDVFRASDAVPPIVEQALADLPQLRTIWLQLGVTYAAGPGLARAHDVAWVENRCPKIEWARLGL
ncbi:CoA-binding protein [Pseudorhodobacter sp. E13]|uniref:CoA-binding protein n=1 Tax=Pseudorhodobacter sp. E13 TaxID=2487931 RepID=UPI000F8ED185|nr:CoA-binding protein [Pseudorhodobacter sp. E13]RUS60630.1 CoA-binding protein [Pseudorhodobacter sp. E13]